MAVDAQRIAFLEEMLDDLDPAVRAAAREALAAHVREGEVFVPPPTDETNVHSHTFFSFNAYGYSPSGFAWRALRRGLAVAGIVDFDVLDGLEEILACGGVFALRTTGGVETRVVVPELRDQVINSPREPGICYFMGTAFGRVPAPETAAGCTLARMRALAQARTRGVMERVNGHLRDVALDYERDVVARTPSANPTERHLLAAYDARARALLGDAAPEFWARVLGIAPEEAAALAADTPQFHEAMRAGLMKFGAPGYAAPEAGAFPTLGEVIDMVREGGGLPTATWLDGESEGERDIGALLDFMTAYGVVIVNIVPDRNWNFADAAVRARKTAALAGCIAACRERGLPLIAGTEMNTSGQPFVDNFRVPALAPYVNDFLEGALLLHGHATAARLGGWSYFSAWAETRFGPAATRDGRAGRNAFYTALGRAGPLCAARRAAVMALDAEAPPATILDKARPRCRAY